MAHITAIVLAAGSGKRLGSRVPKPLVEIDSKPLIVYSLARLSRQSDIKDIVIVVNALNKPGVKSRIRQYRIKKIRHIIPGGRLRQDSVRCGLKYAGENTDLILIHDAARPFIDAKMLSAVISAAKRKGAAVLGVPVKSTIKEVDGRWSMVDGSLIVKRTLNRKNLWEIQTPQVFRKELILKAYKKYRYVSVTDDAALVEKLGAKVSVVEGSYNNIKVTTPEDLVVAEAIARKLRRRIQ